MDQEKHRAAGDESATYFPIHAEHVARRVPWRFDLQAMMILVLLIATGLGLMVNGAAYLGLSLLLLVCPTIVRTVPIWIHRRREGRTKSGFDDPNVLLRSLGIVLLLFLAAVAAFPVFFIAALFLGFPITNVADTRFDDGTLRFGMLGACAAAFLIGRRVYPPRD